MMRVLFCVPTLYGGDGRGSDKFTRVWEDSHTLLHLLRCICYVSVPSIFVQDCIKAMKKRTIKITNWFIKPERVVGSSWFFQRIFVNHLASFCVSLVEKQFSFNTKNIEKYMLTARYQWKPNKLSVGVNALKYLTLDKVHFTSINLKIFLFDNRKWCDMISKIKKGPCWIRKK